MTDVCVEMFVKTLLHPFIIVSVSFEVPEVLGEIGKPSPREQASGYMLNLAWFVKIAGAPARSRV